MRVFIDCGSCDGGTLEEVVKPEHKFDRIYGFEPMPAQFAIIDQRFGDEPNVTLHNYGLSDESGLREMYGLGVNGESSIYSGKRDLDASIVTECLFMEATAFFREHIRPDDTVVAKWNCEGSEIPILQNLIDSEELWKIDAMKVDWDITAVPGLAWQSDAMKEELARVGFDRYTNSDGGGTMIGDTHQARIGNWLRSL